MTFPQIALGTTAALGLLAWQWENWHGEQVWAATQADMAARGYSLSEMDLPPAPPDDQNAAMHPVFAPAMKSHNDQPITLQNPPDWDFGRLGEQYPVQLPSFTYQTDAPSALTLAAYLSLHPQADILAATDVLAGYITGINEAAQRPYADWWPYAPAPGQKDFLQTRAIPSASNVFQFATQTSAWLSLRAQAQLAANDPEGARQTTLALLNTAQIWERESRFTLVSAFISIALEGIVQPHLAQCAHTAGWRDSDRAFLADQLAQTDVTQIPTKALRLTMLSSMRGLLEAPDAMLEKECDLTWENRSAIVGRLLPAGIYKHNAAALYEAERHGFFDPDGDPSTACAAVSSQNPHTLLAAIATPFLSNFRESASKVQQLRTQTRQYLQL